MRAIQDAETERVKKSNAMADEMESLSKTLKIKVEIVQKSLAEKKSYFHKIVEKSSKEKKERDTALKELVKIAKSASKWPSKGEREATQQTQEKLEEERRKVVDKWRREFEENLAGKERSSVPDSSDW